MTRFALLFALALAAPAVHAQAQDYPAREIRSICNFAPGSGADIIVRYYSDQLARLAGKPVIGDGHTIHITPASSTLAAAPHIFKQLPFDPINDQKSGSDPTEKIGV